jgi:L-rhamnose mutarotase
MRVASHSVLGEGQESGYEEAHATVPADLPESLRRVGATHWRIWRSGRRLFHLVGCEDFTAAMAALDKDPVNSRWQEFIGAHVDHFETSDGSRRGNRRGWRWVRCGNCGPRPKAAAHADGTKTAEPTRLIPSAQPFITP